MYNNNNRTSLNSFQNSSGLIDSKIECQVCQIAKYRHHKVSFDLQFQDIIAKLLEFRSHYNSQGNISDVEQILRECEWTDILVKLLEYGNSHVLLSHKYRVEIEDEHV